MTCPLVFYATSTTVLSVLTALPAFFHCAHSTAIAAVFSLCIVNIRVNVSRLIVCDSDYTTASFAFGSNSCPKKNAQQKYYSIRLRVFFINTSIINLHSSCMNNKFLPLSRHVGSLVWKSKPARGSGIRTRDV